MPEELSVVELAKLAIAYEKMHAVFFPFPAKQMAELGSRILLDLGIRHWISPGGDSITCATCRHISYNPHDVKEVYCGHCHEFVNNESGD
jgi:hypothetical protein